MPPRWFLRKHYGMEVEEPFLFLLLKCLIQLEWYNYVIAPEMVEAYLINNIAWKNMNMHQDDDKDLMIV